MPKALYLEDAAVGDRYASREYPLDVAIPLPGLLILLMLIVFIVRQREKPEEIGQS